MKYESLETQNNKRFSLGTLGHPAIFFWSLGVMMFSPSKTMLWPAVLCILVLVVIYPCAWRNILTMRRLGLLLILVIPPLFFFGEVDQVFLGIGISTSGLQTSSQILFRYLVVMYALEGFTNSVDISSIAGLLERCGLHGLGFSMGVALNFIPTLQKSITRSWQSLKMKGGLRKKRWHGLMLFSLTAVTNVLVNAEDIALAAESRAFNPGKTRHVPIKKGNLDWVLLPLCVISIVLSIIIK